MIIATEQPYFAPYPGFLYKAHLADIIVLLDQVQFPRGTTWISRNRFKNDQGTLWLTVPVWKKGRGLQPIGKVKICYDFGWTRKHLRSLRTAYAKAPYFWDHFRFIEETYRYRCDRLVDFNLRIIQYLLEQCRIETKVIRQSDLEIHTRGTRLPVDICLQLKGTVYLTQKAALKYLDTGMFRDAGIALRSFQPPALIYPQLWGPFIGDLSSFDLLFNCGPKASAILKGQS